MYESFFGMEHTPFVRDIPAEKLYESDAFRETLGRLCYVADRQMFACFLQALFPQKCRLNSSKLHGEFPHYCISSAGTLSGAGEEPLQAYKVY